jgi:hypothetical protein
VVGFCFVFKEVDAKVVAFRSLNLGVFLYFATGGSCHFLFFSFSLSGGVSGCLCSVIACLWAGMAAACEGVASLSLAGLSLAPSVVLV